MTFGKLSKIFTPHSDLVPLLEKHGLTWELFSRKGRLPKELCWVVEKRRYIITELHSSGMPWTSMTKVTGLSLGSIGRGTRAAWNSASRANRVANAARIGHARKGESKSWLSDQLKQNWVDGKYDFHRGRIRSTQERETLRAASLRPEVKQRRRKAALQRWLRPEAREKLLAYHRSEAVRLARSEGQSRRMIEDPVKWTRGRGAWVETIKSTKLKVWTRSSYERVLLALLEADPEVVRYYVEARLELPNGRWILPDFIVIHTDGSVVLVEVKASWVLKLPAEHKIQRRLHAASTFAASRGWSFLVWTEKDFPNAKSHTI